MRRCLLLLLVFFPCVASAQMIHGHIVGVTDGDTVTLLDQEKRVHKIRIAGIDAPEKSQAFGQAAKKQMSIMAFDREAIADCRKRDNRERQICVVKVDGIDVGLEQVRAGMAWWYRKYASNQTPAERVDYEDAEAKASSHRRGLWQQEDPFPPWEWRRGRRQ